MVDDSRIRKTKINAREFFQTIAEVAVRVRVSLCDV